MEVGGVAANARNTAAVSIVGVQPRLEPEVSFYGDHIVQGEELAPDDVYGIVVGKALLDSFETRLGRKIVLMTQGADKETASRAFRIRGVYRAELEATEKRYVFISLEAARELLGAPGAVTGICLKLPDRERAEGVAQRIRPDLPPDVGVYTWRQLLPLLLGYMDMFNSVMLLWYLVVFIAMAFGLVNTTLMAVLERTREFGLLKALGMKPIWIVRGVLTECLILLAVGLCLGNLCGVLTVVAFSGGINLAFLAEGSQYFGLGNIIVPLLAVRDMALANGVILGLGLVVCLYPAIKAGRITPVEAMHG